MKLYIFLLVLSVMARAIDHIKLWRQTYQSWLPWWVFGWKTKISVLDANHFYMGLYLISFGLGMYVSPYSWWWKPVEIYLYFQVFNLFFHVILKKRVYWRLPFFRFLL